LGRSSTARHLIGTKDADGQNSTGICLTASPHTHFELLGIWIWHLRQRQLCLIFTRLPRTKHANQARSCGFFTQAAYRSGQGSGDQIA
jgi:hypothetical protein